MVEMLDELKRHNWQISQFVQDAINFGGITYWFRQYRKGIISAEEAKRRVASNS